MYKHGHIRKMIKEHTNHSYMFIFENKIEDRRAIIGQMYVFLLI